MRTNPATRPARSGIVLLIVLGVLAVMSVLAMSFIAMARLERDISRNYVDKTRAVMAAESGMEYGLLRLREMAASPPSAELLRAFVYDPDGHDDLIDAATAAFQVTNARYACSGVVANRGVGGVEYFALRVEDESGKLNLNDSNAQWNLDDDPLPDPEDDPDFVNAEYRLSTLLEGLCMSLFHDDAKASLVSAKLLQARAVLPGDRFTSMDQVHETLVDGGYLDEDEYERFTENVTLWSWQDSSVLRPTFHLDISHPDDQPYPDTLFDVYFYADMQTKRYELEPRCPVNVNTTTPELLEALIAPVRGWYLYEGAPNSLMKTAPNAPWTKAMRASSFSWEDSQTTNGFLGSTFPFNWTAWEEGDETFTLGRRMRYGEARLTAPLTEPDPTLPATLAQRIHDRIHGADLDGDGEFDGPGDVAPDPFSTWDEFTRFLYDLVDTRTQIDFTVADEWAIEFPLTADEEADRFPYFQEKDSVYRSDADGPVPGFSRFQADALLANFNPNPMLNDVNPDMHIFRHVDKAQLTSYTTELCFQPTGVFQIECVGAVRSVLTVAKAALGPVAIGPIGGDDVGGGPVLSMDPGPVLAQSTITSTIEAYSPVRISSQEQFMGRPGNGYDPHNPSSLYDVFAENESFESTAGCDLSQGSGLIAGSGRRGPSLMSYPEPLRNAPSLCIEDDPGGGHEYLSTVDGYLALPTWQPSAESYGANDPMLLAPMSRRAVPDEGSWKKQSLALGGMLPVVCGKNPATASDDIDTVNVGGGRGVMLTWADDYSISSDYPNPSWAPIPTWDPAPDAYWIPDQPWMDHRHWKRVWNDYGQFPWISCGSGHFFDDMTMIVGPRQTRVAIIPPPPVGPKFYRVDGENCNRIAWNLPSEMPVTPTGAERVPGNLMPDGAFSEAGRALSYPATNLGSDLGWQGSLCFWVKPAWDAGYSTRFRQFFSMGHIGATFTHPLDLLYFPMHNHPGDEVTNLVPGINFGSMPYPVPTHSFMWGWMWINTCDETGWPSSSLHSFEFAGATVSQTATDHFPGRNEALRGSHESIAFYGRQWNFFSLSYRNDRETEAMDQAQININGVTVSSPFVPGQLIGNPDVFKQVYWEEQQLPMGEATVPTKPEEVVLEPKHMMIGHGYLRFGWCEENAGPTADSTYDDIATFALPVAPSELDAVGWTEGRYLNCMLPDDSGMPNSSAVGLYTSPVIDLSTSLNVGPLNASSKIRLLGAAWTLWWPRYNGRPDSGSYDVLRTPTVDGFGIAGVDLHEGMISAAVPEDDPVTGAWDPISIDILTPETREWTWSGASESDVHTSYFNFEKMLTCAGGSDARASGIEFRKGEDFRFRAYFHLAKDNHLLESPVLDDVTFYFAGPTPKIIRWQIK